LTAEKRICSRKMTSEIQDGFIRVENKIYDSEKLAKFHPGGPLFVKVTTIKHLVIYYFLF